MQEQLYTILSASIQFCSDFEEKYYTFLKTAGFRKRIRKSKMELAELLTIQILFHLSSYTCFKQFYEKHVEVVYRDCFFLVSYSQVNKMMNDIPFLIDLFLKTRLQRSEKYYFIDSTSLAVCHRVRAPFNRVFAQQAKFGYSTINGNFFGFKLHLITDHRGEIASYQILPANTHDSKPMVELADGLAGILCGDKGYISEEKRKILASKGLKIITPNKENALFKTIYRGVEKYMLRKRGLIESVFNKLKNVIHIQTNRSRSVAGFLSHCLSALLAYTFDEKKPAVQIP